MKEFFETHNIFDKDIAYIVKYLKEQEDDNELIILSDEGDIKAAMFLVIKGQNSDGSGSTTHRLPTRRPAGLGNATLETKIWCLGSSNMGQTRY